MPISNMFIPKLLNQFRALNYDEGDIDMMRYSLQAIFWEIEKLIYLFILFSLIGYTVHFLVTLISLVSIRVFAGGYHSKTALNCLLVSLVGFVLAIIVLPMIPLNSFTTFILSAFCLLATFMAAPIRSLEKEAIQNKENDGIKRIIVLFITSFLLAYAIFNPSHTYSHSIIWIITLQNGQLLLEYFKRKKENIS